MFQQGNYPPVTGPRSTEQVKGYTNKASLLYHSYTVPSLHKNDTLA